MKHVNPLVAAALALLSCLPVAAQNAAAPAPSPSVVERVEAAVERGARAAASGVERGVSAAASGVARGARAAASGVERGAKATSEAVGKVVGTPASGAAK